MSCKIGHVPDNFKKAHVTPIFKKSGSVNEYTNYRPIQLFPMFPKFLKKLYSNSFSHNIHEYDFFSIDQSAFLTNLSTQTSLQRLNEE